MLGNDFAGFTSGLMRDFGRRRCRVRIQRETPNVGGSLTAAYGIHRLPLNMFGEGHADASVRILAASEEVVPLSAQEHVCANDFRRRFPF